MNPILFLGGGRITTALAAGLRRAGHSDALLVHDRHASRMRKLEREFGVRGEADLARAVARAGLLIVAVRPGSMQDLLRTVPLPDRPLIAVSLAAGVTLAMLRARMGPPAQWARAMPSPACRAGRGLTALAFDHLMPESAREKVRSLFRAVGRVLEISEKKFDAFTVTYSVSHGYHALAALAAAAQKLGLDRATALDAAAHALADGIFSWREERLPLADLLREAATPGGIAATVMKQLNAGGYQRLIERALRAGVRKARGKSARKM